MLAIGQLLENNKRWAQKLVEEKPDFFEELAQQQSPKFLWIGCSDSRVSANVIVDLAPGEVFVHRNVANIVSHTDLNCLSVLQFAIEALQVEHVIVCGHYACGGVIASMEQKRHGLIDNWLRDIRDTANLYSDRLASITDHDERVNELCRLNVAQQVLHVAETTIVQDAWVRGQELAIHGWIYGLKDGIIRDLGFSLSGQQGITELRERLHSTDKLHTTGTAS
ncbi:MAG TPA: carbonate dehydratase [Pyrinomonadaceae bacterium]|nr:carbonate dehydratase [Pyrinomonadaceae bacterium]